jgi:HAD superfamily hydrolase (TIGR01549 family)
VDYYESISKKMKNDLKSTASSHNKCIYFKKLLETLNKSIEDIYEINELYWKTFFDTMECYQGVKEFIYWNKKMGIKIGILTDYETEYQIKKLKVLGLFGSIDIVVTSEEVGIEKPSIHMFQTILANMKLNSTDVIMIGDDFNKDIIGANNSNIYSYWFSSDTNKNSINNNYSTFSSFTELHNNFIKIYTELIYFQNISRFIGERFDLVQAGGGNSSVKVNDWMIIKSSGISMSNIDATNGYVIINNNQIVNDIMNNNIQDVMYYNVSGKNRGSIETFMHSILKKYTIHLHPIQVNRILISKNAKQIISELFPKSLVIDYFTPGIKVCNEIYRQYNGENIIFLVNHGIIITSNLCEEVYILLETVISTLETYQNLNYDKYKFTNTISKFINEKYNINNVSYLCQNIELLQIIDSKPHLFNEKISFPDALIYCGINVCILNTMQDTDIFVEKYSELPKVLIYNSNVYINACSLKKCREIEEVLLSNLLILDSTYDKNYLSDNEICFLNNWEAELYIQIV